MVTTFWSVKGGVGVSTVAALWALAVAGTARPTTLVDLCGDQPAVLGLDPPVGPGISEWASAPEADVAAIERIATRVNVDLGLVHRGAAAWPASVVPLSEALASLAGVVVIDAGLAHGPLRELVRRSDHHLLVVRSCYLNLRAAVDIDPVPDGVVLVRERGRALGAGDVESVTGAPIVAQIAWDPAVARCIDAGVATTRVPRSLLRSLARAERDV